MNDPEELRTAARRQIDQAIELVQSAQNSIARLEGTGWADLYGLLGDLHGDQLPTAARQVTSLPISGLARR